MCPHIELLGLHKKHLKYFSFVKSFISSKNKKLIFIVQMCMAVLTKQLQFLTVYDFNSKYLLMKDVSLTYEYTR